MNAPRKTPLLAPKANAAEFVTLQFPPSLRLALSCASARIKVLLDQRRSPPTPPDQADLIGPFCPPLQTQIKGEQKMCPVVDRREGNAGRQKLSRFQQQFFNAKGR